MSNGDIVPERGGDDKSPLEGWFIPLCLLLLTLLGFGFGRLSAKAVPEPVQIRSAELPSYSSPLQQQQVAAVAEEGSYVASKNGKKYYPLSCSGANRIKDENKIYFNTQALAESAGYSKAANCSF